MNRDSNAYYQHVKTELGNLFSKYDLKFGGVRLQRPQQPQPGGGKKVCSWNRLFGSASARQAWWVDSPTLPVKRHSGRAWSSAQARRAGMA
jgi:hypothetical protein